MKRSRCGFTLVELLFVLGIIGILSVITIMAINPQKTITATNDATRLSEAKQLQNAFNQYVISVGGTVPVSIASQIPSTAAAAIPVCRYGITDITCVNLDVLIPSFIVKLPQDDAETSVLLSGFKIYKAGNLHVVNAMYMGSIAGVGGGTGPGSSSVGSSSSSSMAPFSPTDIPNLALWLKADAITSLTDGDPVPVWIDSSPAGNDATQASTDNQPFYWQNVINGHPAVRFDGGDDWLEAPPIDTGAVTIIAVVNVSDATPPYIVSRNVDGADINAYSFSPGLANPPLAGIARYSNPLFWENSGVSTDISGDGQFHIIEGKAPGDSNYYYYLDGSLDSSNTGAGGPLDSSTSVTDIGVYKNDGAYLTGDIAEILLYTSALSPAQEAQINAYLQAKYALP